MASGISRKGWKATLKPRIAPFDRHARKYEAWFSRNRHAYLSELKALRKLIPRHGRNVEVGVGSGRFAKPLGVNVGIEPSREMRKIAQNRGMEIIDGVAEALPIAGSILDTVLIVTTICFVNDIERSLREAYRVLAPTGRLVIGFIDRKSFLGLNLEKLKPRSVFYSVANFYSAEELLHYLKSVGFSRFKFRQTIFHKPDAIKRMEPVKEGYGEGAFLVVAASK